MESDLLRFWGLDLVADLGTPRLTWRRLGVLIERMPEESALMRSLVGTEAAQWTPERHLLAGVIDSLGVVAYLLGGNLVALGGAKTNPVPEPKPIERPGVEVAKPTGERGLMSLARKMGQSPVRLT
ncbi:MULTISPECIES: hypothetical protein [Streptomyces]|uniref:hypothetical protein n=1 Tax=Streptomyces TaxID=1883 RepID=UPI0011816809|nr:hypothetical protein [Streptomyces kasugaensis]